MANTLKVNLVGHPDEVFNPNQTLSSKFLTIALIYYELLNLLQLLLYLMSRRQLKRQKVSK